ncbi:hypothetical protein M0813_04270 [Anaeramoeba flamelloides]|uniref:PAS domain-containing protein n=1 Tax=Anaeramoeba flamelloides TaxID=1746091 RepID=A0ABQ8XK15_9EUKA|nr:hypothetical protein M0813_04270 [Anaeramoeba flamelloides]
MGNNKSIENFTVINTENVRSEKKYLNFIKQKKDPICIIDRTSTIIGYNLSFAKFLGFEDAETMGVVMYTMANFSAEEQSEGKLSEELIKKKFRKIIASGSFDFDWNISGFGSKILNCHIWANVVRVKSRVLIQLIFRNLEDNQNVSQIDESLMTSTEVTPREIAQFCMEECVRVTKSQIGYLGFMNKTKDLLYVYAWSNSVMASCKTINKPLVFNANDGGLWSDVIKDNSNVIVNNYLKFHPSKKGIPKGHVPIKNFLSIPIFANPEKRKNVILLCAVANKKGDYNNDDIAMLTKLVTKMWEVFKKNKNF